MSFQLYPGQLEQLQEMLLRGCRSHLPEADPDLEAIKNADLLTWSNTSCLITSTNLPP
jgi:hypothetical protein